MNNGNSEEEALKTLCKDVSALKEVIAEGLSFLKERSQEITRLERRIEASYPEYKAFKTPKSQPIEVTKEKLQDVFNALAAATREQGDGGFNQAVREYPPETILALAKQRGVKAGKSLGKKVLKDLKTQVYSFIQVDKPLDLSGSSAEKKQNLPFEGSEETAGDISAERGASQAAGNET